MNESEERQHWNAVYAQRAGTEVSWYEAEPSQSLKMIAATGVAPSASLIDVGGGASLLVDHLLARGHTDISVLDISAEVLAQVGTRLGILGQHVALLEQNVRTFQPTRPYALWHDRAVFHFLTDALDRARYRKALLAATVLGSHALIATFGPEGPVRCSGLVTCRYDANSLEAELGAPFRLVEHLSSEHVTPTGKAQQFLYARFLRIPG